MVVSVVRGEEVQFLRSGIPQRYKGDKIVHTPKTRQVETRIFHVFHRSTHNSHFLLLLPMARSPKGSVISFPSSSRLTDGLPSRSSIGSGSLPAWRKSSNAGMGRANTSKPGRSLQEISIPEGMDEEVCALASASGLIVVIKLRYCARFVR